MTDWKTKSRSFDTVAENYDLYRPGYPASLAERMLAVSGFPAGGHILEVGSGTGKATEMFTSSSLPIEISKVSIHCVEPGENLIRIAQTKFNRYPGISFEQASFEECREQPARFDLVISAQAWHWVEPSSGYNKAARFLKEDGWLALFWNVNPDPQGEIFQELERIYQLYYPHSEQPATPYEAVIQERKTAIQESGRFDPVLIYRFPWSERYTTKQYLGLLNTYSDHLTLPEEQQKPLYKGIAEVIDRYGGWIEKPYLAVLFMARKRDKA